MQEFFQTYWLPFGGALGTAIAALTFTKSIAASITKHVKAELMDTFATKHEVAELTARTKSINYKIADLQQLAWRAEGRVARDRSGI